MTNDETKLLKASFGVYTKIKGSQIILHYTRKWSHNIQLEIETSEIAQLRNLRFALDSGKLNNLSLDKPTFTLYLAGLLAHALNSLGIEEIFQFGGRLSPEWEGLKLLLASGKIRIPENFKYHCSHSLIGDENFSSHWKVLHQRLEKPQFVGAATLLVAEDGLPVKIGQISKQANNMLFLNAFKTGSEQVTQLIDLLFLDDTVANTLIAFRTTNDEKIEVFNVFCERQELANLSQTLDDLTQKGWHAYYQFFPDLDRDFLLPFSGSYGVCVLLLSRKDIGNPPQGLTKHKPSPGQTRSLALYQEGTLANYDGTLSNEIASFEFQPEPNWTEWCQSFDWDTEIPSAN